MRIGYARIAREGESLASQEGLLATAGCTQVFSDVASGDRSQLNGLHQVLATLRSGDTLVVCDLNRLAWSMPQLVETVAAIATRDIRLISLREQIDTGLDSGQFFKLLEQLAQFDREANRERTSVGMRAAQARGVRTGRPVKLNPEKQALARELLRNTSLTQEQVSALLGISRSTLYRYLRESADSSTPRAAEDRPN